MSDTSAGDPDAWNWSFGDGGFADTRTATHVYTKKGRYIITLNVSNNYGTSTARNTVVARMGTNETMNTTIRGLSFRYIGGMQHAILNERVLTAWTFLPNSSILEFSPPPDRGFGNVTLYRLTGPGSGIIPPPGTVYGNVTRVKLQSREMILDFLDPAIGPEKPVQLHPAPVSVPAWGNGEHPDLAGIWSVPTRSVLPISPRTAAMASWRR